MKKQKKQLTYGATELIGFVAIVPPMLMLIICSVSILIFGIAKNAIMDSTLNETARSIVVCTSMKEATKTAEEEIKKVEKKNKLVKNPKITVSYAAGAKKEWKKGNIIQVQLEGEIGVIQPLIKKVRVSTNIMIERNGS